MHFTKLRLTGFKSFVEPTELVIDAGMTGIVGPNGCGKSNLVEALRWVMGENRAKQMRGSAMDDVIFNGTQTRPARNLAEVSITVDNSDRIAPAAFNDNDELVVVRRIERDGGSTFRINGKEVRARDVQLLFADAASGSHSAALVSQGRVGALINARPTDRRMLLEEAAGITGLHSRRHEAELRLNGAEANLERLGDVMAAIEAQLQNVKRQARQANRYRRVGQQVREFEAMQLHLRYRDGEDASRAARERLGEADRQVAEITSQSAQATTAASEAAAGLPELRQNEAATAAGLHRLAVAAEGLDAEDARIRELQAQLQSRLSQIGEDESHAKTLQNDAAGAVEALRQERQTLQAVAEGQDTAQTAARERASDVETVVIAREAELATLADSTAAGAAHRDSLARRVDEAEQRIARLSSRQAQVQEERGAMAADLQAERSLRELASVLEEAETAAATARQRLEDTEAAQGGGDAIVMERRDELRQIESEAAALSAEARALMDLLAVKDADLWPPLVDAVSVEPGYEVALGMALGDDLTVSADEAAPVHWRTLPVDEAAPALPSGAEPLHRFVNGPAALAPRLAQVGVVAAAEGARLAAALRQGQRLVSREGDLWRWDGFTSRAGAETAAATRLAQRNRLNDLRAACEDVEGRLERARSGYDSARTQASAAVEAVARAREDARTADRLLDDLRRRQANAEREAAARSARAAGLDETLARIAGDLEEAQAARSEDAETLAALPPLDAARQRLASLRGEVAAMQRDLADARKLEAELRGEATARAARLGRIAEEQQAWQGRTEAAKRQLTTLAERREQTAQELEELRRKPSEIAERRGALLAEIEAAGRARAQAADRLAAQENRSAELEKMRRDAEQRLTVVREDRIRAEAAVEQAGERMAEATRRIHEVFECEAGAVLAAGAVDASKPMPPLEDVVRRLERLKRERDNIGPVNLRAEQEAAELEEQLETMARERADLEAAIARLRQGISALNREGRQRLKEAFTKVDEHFQTLFTRLFGGGTAHLALVGSDDPLEAGLEIMASPPGKRLQTLSLLSGGEQALTALSLLFAVFITNPAPICVLDEVDAPLDNANVERFCNLLSEISDLTKTRFLLITHHDYSMARMDRLYGVTMGERGVSQLVSVDLSRAERLRATA